jgi:hypothetical protein
MEYDEGPMKTGMELQSQSDDKRILVLPSSIAKGGLSKTDRIRGVARSLTVDALAVLDRMRDDCQQPSALRENYYLLYHYLDYLKRFCEGKV